LAFSLHKHHFNFIILKHSALKTSESQPYWAALHYAKQA